MGAAENAATVQRGYEAFNQGDIETLRYWIARHAETTGSLRANWVLDNWSDLLDKFVKVFPHEYKRVLGVKRLETAAHA